MNDIDYISGGIELLDAIEPLWLKLNELHKTLSPHFPETFEKRTFSDRKEILIKKAQDGQIRIDIAHKDANRNTIAYCVSSVDSKNFGEIDSIFVEKPYRQKGIASHLVNMALTWMDSLGIVKKVVLVGYGNDEALRFYEKLGFYPANYELRFKNNKQ